MDGLSEREPGVALLLQQVSRQVSKPRPTSEGARRKRRRATPRDQPASLEKGAENMSRPQGADIEAHSNRETKVGMVSACTSASLEGQTRYTLLERIRRGGR
eukprot:860711-Pyramimonas_sp.AAC.1